jgi:NTP pyrophosphatase (non-canonical NTP hydrolase)
MMEGNKQQEILTITMEECAEVIVECSKIKRFGSMPDNIKNLEKEIGDLMCMVMLLEEAKLIDIKSVEKAIANKRTKLKKWSNLDV